MQLVAKAREKDYKYPTSITNESNKRARDQPN
jgi:hypothetical protein